MSCKMTKEDIKKALKCCSDWSSCDNCPYYYARGGESCVERRLLKDALNLITKQEQEIEELKAENDELLKQSNGYATELIEAKKPL